MKHICHLFSSKEGDAEFAVDFDLLRGAWLLTTITKREWFGASYVSPATIAYWAKGLKNQDYTDLPLTTWKILQQCDGSEIKSSRLWTPNPQKKN